MSSTADTASRALRALTPRSVVARTSLSILVLAMVVGALFSFTASWRVRHAEEQRLVERVNELTATVESAASIACFLNDATLAREIAAGLMKNRMVAGVRIDAGGALLYKAGVSTPSPKRRARIETQSRAIQSPFDSGTTVGRITLYVSNAEIDAQAAAYSRYAILVLVLQVSVVAGGVAWLVYLLVTRPIKRISDELHRMEVRPGMRLEVRSGRRRDEVGKLVMDVNALMARLSDALIAEQDLRHAQEQSERRMRLVFEKADTGILVLDDRGAVQSCNPAFVRILGPDAAAPGVLLGELLDPHGARVAELIESSLRSNEPRDADLELDLGGTRGRVWVELSVNPLGGNLLQGLVIDITERKRAERAAQELAARDPVTGILNRRGVDESLARLIAISRHDPNAAIGLLQIDLDHFKVVNDTYGHEAGDRVLREVTRVLERCVRRTDIVGRLGGDEFVVMLPGIEGPAKAREIADTIIAGINRPIEIGDGRIARVGASIGIAITVRAHESAEQLLRRADAAMYAAKQAGRGRVHLAREPSDDQDDDQDDDPAHAVA